MHIVADLRFQVQTVEGGRGSSDAAVTGRVDADGSVVTVDFSRTPSLLGAGGRRRARALASALDTYGVTVRLRGPTGLLVSLGHGVTAPRWQRLATGSGQIRLGSRRILLRSLRGPRLFAAALPDPRH